MGSLLEFRLELHAWIGLEELVAVGRIDADTTIATGTQKIPNPMVTGPLLT